LACVGLSASSSASSGSRAFTDGRISCTQSILNPWWKVLSTCPFPAPLPNRSPPINPLWIGGSCLITV
jgi:hypothetical protein